MPTISEIKEHEVTETPILLFECDVTSGRTERWSTHGVQFEGQTYAARILRHNVFEFHSYSDDGIDGSARVSLVLSNADSYFSEIGRSEGWKGAKLKIRFVFFNLASGEAVSEARTLFAGIGNPPDEITETTLRITFNNRLSLQRVALPDVRIQKRCPWLFPSTAEQREAALTGVGRGKHGPFVRCGYSPDIEMGCGNQIDGQPFQSCDHTRAQCEQRGMFRNDANGLTTARFGGIEYVPPGVSVRSYGEKGNHFSAVIDNEARYNDFVPMVYGTAWYFPPVIFARNDGNLTHLEVLLGMGEMQGVLRVVANDIEIPRGHAGANMTATGWYNLVSTGSTNGAFNLDFTDSNGQTVGDPYGSMAVLSLVVPNQVSDGRSMPRVKVLAEGQRLDRWQTTGEYLDAAYTNNPAWIILDVLRRSGWSTDEIDVSSFARAAAYCDEVVEATGLDGATVPMARRRCNVVLQKRRSAADVIRGIRNAAGLYLTMGAEGLLELHPEGTLARQQGTRLPGSNSLETLNGGWPAYEFGDGTGGFSGILRRDDGSPSLRVWSRSNADSPNRFSVEFQDECNGYQQDSLSLADEEDIVRGGQEVTSPLNALGLPNVFQAAAVARVQLDKSLRGNTYVEFTSHLSALGLKPGDLITLTYLKEGWQRQAFRLVRIAPGPNYETTLLTAQYHDDSWYSASEYIAAGEGGTQPGYEVGVPKPLSGSGVTAEGESQFGVTERSGQDADGGAWVMVSAAFLEPRKPQVSRIGIPMLNLRPESRSVGGVLQGGCTFYYAISSVDASGLEGAASFLVRADIPEGTDTNCVKLSGLRFPAGTESFRVYRGRDAFRLMRIGDELPVAGEFEDTGLEATPTAPVDANYDHANFYWRLELLGEQQSVIHSATTIGHPSLQMILDEYRGMKVRIMRGRGSGQERLVAGNTADTITLVPAWSVVPDDSSIFVVSEQSWNFGAAGASSPVEFAVPNRTGATVHILGLAANVHGRECSTESSLVTRWRITGSSGSQMDDGVPPKPSFGVGLTGKGMLEVAGIGFEELHNTRSISSGTLALSYWDEMNGACEDALTAAVSAEDAFVRVDRVAELRAGDILQLERELVRVEEVLAETQQCSVVRAEAGSVASTHAAGTAVYRLSRKAFVLPFPRDFFGSSASGSYSYPVRLPNARIASAELHVSNSQGDSPVAVACYTQTIDGGLRTVSGGQACLQVDGWLASETDAAPPLVMGEATAVRDVYAVVSEAPSGGPIEISVKAAGESYCSLTIPAGAKLSNIVSGFGKAPLQESVQLGLDVVSVPSNPADSPGQDLTVIIRL